jgi:hypothetical protein
MNPAVAEFMNVARLERAGPTLTSYVALVAVLAENPVPVPIATAVPEDAAVPTLRVSVPSFTVGSCDVSARVPFELGRVTETDPASAGDTIVTAPLVAPFTAMPPDPIVAPPSRLTAVFVEAPRAVTVPSVSLSAVRYTLESRVQVLSPVLFRIPVPVNAAIAVRSASRTASLAFAKSTYVLEPVPIAIRPSSVIR